MGFVMRWLVIFAALFLLFGCGDSNPAAPEPSPSPSPTPEPVADCDVIALALDAKIVGEKGGGVYRWRTDQDARVSAIPLYEGTGSEGFDASTCPQNIGPYSWSWVPSEVCVVYGDVYSSSVVLHCVRPVFQLCVDVSVAASATSSDLARGSSCFEIVP